MEGRFGDSDLETQETLRFKEEGNPFFHSQTHNTAPGLQRVKQIWAIGGGKGGVGKSLLSSSLAISLARQGNKVIAIDLDLGAANLHTTLGVDLPERSISDFLSNRTSKLDQCVSSTPIPNLYLISGAADSLNVANITTEQKQKILQNLRSLDADYLVIDLGAGTNINTIDFFLFSDVSIITLLPEPTSIENGYRFIKTGYFRRLKLVKALEPIYSLIDAAMDPKNSDGIKTPADLFKEVNRLHPELGSQLKEEIAKFRPKLILNQIRTQTDIDIGFSIKTVTKRYFGVELDYIGYLDYDSSAWQAVRRKRPIMIEFPTSKVVSSIERMAQYLVKRHGHLRNDL